ncbi:carbon-nitrogen hydrolase [Mariannaea sp. PMI_226]|nr:carbon-nitrogen hydrolase [Mariannaea sp. PMI_226]
MARMIKVAVVQLHTTALDPHGNFTKASEYIRQAASQGAQLAVLPEYHLTGYVPEDPVFHEQVDMVQCKKYLNRYCELARELSICIVPGTLVERHDVDPDAMKMSLSGSVTLRDAKGTQYQLLNTAYFISNDGSILGSYRKKNLWHTERAHQSRGEDKHTAIATPLGKIGLLTCWDLAFPEAFRELARDGADMIIMPTCWTVDESWPYGLKLNPNYESLILNSMITSRCFENSCAVVFANAGGPADVYIGLSQVTMPFTGPIGGIWDSSEGFFVADIDMEVLREAELNYKVREDVASEGWHYGH